MKKLRETWWKNSVHSDEKLIYQAIFNKISYAKNLEKIDSWKNEVCQKSSLENKFDKMHEIKYVTRKLK